MSEALCWAGYRLSEGRWFSYSDVLQRMREQAESPLVADDMKAVGMAIPFDQRPHPYYGFGKPYGFDFLSSVAPSPRDVREITVALCGGSVMFNLYRTSRGVLSRALSEVPALKGRKVRVILLGWYAWKQPQQVLSVTYYLAMGGHYDVLLELDGRNEIVDAMYNVERHVFPAYPWLWESMTSQALSVERATAIGRLSLFRENRRRAATLYLPWHYSTTASLVWRVLDVRLERQLAAALTRLKQVQDAEGASLPDYRSGPKVSFTSEDQALAYFADVWQGSSLQMHRISLQNGAKYFHFLQPDLQVPGKPLSAEEKSMALSRPADRMQSGYRHLLRAGEYLRGQGVLFTSLTGVFGGVPQTLYKDDCHVVKEGSDILALAMAHTVAEYLKDHRL